MRKRIFITTVSVALATLILCFSLAMGVLYDYFEDQIKSELMKEAGYIAQGIENFGYDYFENLEVKAGDNRIIWTSPEGVLIYDSADSDYKADKGIYYDKKLKDGSVLRISSTNDALMDVFTGMLRPVILIVFFAVAICSIVASYLAKMIMSPINNINIENPGSKIEYEELEPLFRKINRQRTLLDRQMSDFKARQQEFTANVSHELKTPLTSISGFAETIAEGIAKPEDAPRFAGKIYDEVQRLISLVNDIIELSKLDSDVLTLEKQRVDLYEIAENVWSYLGVTAEKRGISFDLSGEKAEIEGIPKVLDELIYNLCDNAIKYNRENGSVKLQVRREGENVRLTVEDTGIGIPEEHQSRVFERFYRVDKSRSKEAGGTGLGLSIVKHAAVHHNADITLKSQVGEGTTVEVLFKKKDDTVY